MDFIDDETLAQQGRVEKGKLTFSGQEFSVVVLPGIERIPPATLAKLGEFAKSGGVLIATRRLPSLGPGFLRQDTESAEVARRVEELFKKDTAPGHFIVDENQPLEEELAGLYPPDVSISPRSRDVGFIHRHTDTSEIYFIANTSNRRFEGAATFRVKRQNAEWWNLFTGEATAAETTTGSEGGTVLKLDMEPYGSRLVVFSDRHAPQAPAAVAVQLPESVDLSCEWQVTFEATGKEISVDTLRSWTELPGMQYFSGRATYRRKFVAPAGFLANGFRADLNFGEGTPLPVQQNAYFQAWLDGPVREAAELYMNGQRVGTVWHPPYEIDVTRFLRAGENELRIVVGNLAVNEMAGSPLPNRAELTARYGERFQDQGNNLVEAVPSGLTGPIRLIARGQAAIDPGGR